jgi:hypothetical protein
MAADEAPRKTFTVAEANAALPALARRVTRLRELRDEIRRSRELLDVLWGRLEAGETVLDAIGRRQAVLDELSDEFGVLVGEVEASGVVLRDLDPGLVDFPALVRGVPIYLCWQAGEPAVAFWHSPSEGFAGRKPIASIDESGSRGPM